MMHCSEITTLACTASTVLFFFQVHDHFWLLMAALLGLCFGSFLNVVIYRLPLMRDKTRPTSGMNLCFPSSHCPHCGHDIAARDNLPVLGYVLLGGRCRHCQTPIGARYPLVELLSGCLCVISAWVWGPTWACLLAWLFIWLGISIAFMLWDKRQAKHAEKCAPKSAAKHDIS